MQFARKIDQRPNHQLLGSLRNLDQFAHFAQRDCGLSAEHSFLHFPCGFFARLSREAGHQRLTHAARSLCVTREIRAELGEFAVETREIIAHPTYQRIGRSRVEFDAVRLGRALNAPRFRLTRIWWFALDHRTNLGDELVEISRAPRLAAKHQRRFGHGAFRVTLERAPRLFAGHKLLRLIEHHQLVRRKQSVGAQLIEHIHQPRARAIEVKARDIAKLRLERIF